MSSKYKKECKDHECCITDLETSSTVCNNHRSYNSVERKYCKKLHAEYKQPCDIIWNAGETLEDNTIEELKYIIKQCEECIVLRKKHLEDCYSDTTHIGAVRKIRRIRHEAIYLVITKTMNKLYNDIRHENPLYIEILKKQSNEELQSFISYEDHPILYKFFNFPPSMQEEGISKLFEEHIYNYRKGLILYIYLLYSQGILKTKMFDIIDIIIKYPRCRLHFIINDHTNSVSTKNKEKYDMMLYIIKNLDPQMVKLYNYGSEINNTIIYINYLRSLKMYDDKIYQILSANNIKWHISLYKEAFITLWKNEVFSRYRVSNITHPRNLLIDFIESNSLYEGTIYYEAFHGFYENYSYMESDDLLYYIIILYSENLLKSGSFEKEFI